MRRRFDVAPAAACTMKQCNQFEGAVSGLVASACGPLAMSQGIRLIAV
jgi:hypothetical protein